jgi:hypothetical protein
MERLGDVLLIVGWAVVFLGLGAVLMTVSLTPEQIASLLRASPKLAQNIFLFLPAPAHFRLLGVATMFLGLLLVAAATALRNGDLHS